MRANHSYTTMKNTDGKMALLQERNEPWASRNARWGLAGVLVLLGASAMLSGCSKGGETSEEAPTVTVQVGAAENGDIQQKVTTDAVLYPLEQAALVPKIASPVKKFYVEKGSKVHAGQLLAELEGQDVEGAQQDALGGQEQAQASYDAAVQKAQQDKQLAKQELDSAQKLYEARQNLYKEGAVSAKDVDDSSVALTQAKAAYDTAQKELDLKVAQGQLNSAKGKNQAAAAQVSYTKVVSPIDGVVTDRPVYPGEMPATGSPVITVMNLSEIVARAHVSQQEAAMMKVGNAATIVAPGVTAPIKGKVTLVSPAVDPSSTTVEVWVQAPNPGEKLRPGGSAQVSIVAQTIPHTTVAPASAILTDPDGTTSVIVLDVSTNAPSKRKVKVGIRSGDDVQILSGLKEGERVVTVGAFQLYNEDDPILAKTKVQVQAPKMPEEDDEDEDQ